MRRLNNDQLSRLRLRLRL